MERNCTASKFIRALAGFFAFIIFSIPVNATEPGGGIKGRVSTSEGNPAAFVTVQLANTNKAVLTGEDGSFYLRNIAAGTYTLEISLVGFETVTQQVTVADNQVSNVEITLQLNDKELEEVIVQAGGTKYKIDLPSNSLRLSRPLIQVPQNIQVVSSKVLADQQIFDMLEGVSRNVSGVTKLEHWDNYVRLNMRGARIAPFRNGMNIQSTWGPLAEDLSMVERVEFVKGPAGFMMSNGEPAGFYNIVTKKPTGVTKGEVRFTAGSFDLYRATLDLDGKLSKDGKLLYRFNLMGQEKNSFRDFESNSRYTIAPVLKYKFNDKTSLTLEYTYQFMQMSAVGSAYAFSANKLADLPRSATIASPGIDPTDIKDHSAFAILEHELSNKWKLTGQLAYFNYNQVGSSVWMDTVMENGDGYRYNSIWDAFNESKFAQFFVNGREQTGAVSHTILAGLDLGTKKYMADWGQLVWLDNTTPFNIYNPVYTNPHADLPVFDRSLSLRQRAGSNILSQSFRGFYLQDELGFWDDKIRLTLAGRITHTEDSQYGTGTDETQFTPRVGLSVSIDNSTSVYALYDQAFVPQAGADRLGNAFDPITGNNTEFGIKKDWFGGKWNTSASAYMITRNNVLTVDPEDINFSAQLGQTKTKGVEVDIRGEIVRNLDVVLNYAYTEGYISKDTKAANVNDGVPGIAKHITNGWLSYRFSDGAVKGLGIAAGYQFQSGRSPWFVDTESKLLPDYFRLDGGISWQFTKLSLALNFENILDEYLYTGGPYDAFYYWQAEAPRNFRFSIGYKF